MTLDAHRLRDIVMRARGAAEGGRGRRGDGAAYHRRRGRSDGRVCDPVRVEQIVMEAARQRAQVHAAGERHRSARPARATRRVRRSATAGGASGRPSCRTCSHVPSGDAETRTGARRHGHRPRAGQGTGRGEGRTRRGGVPGIGQGATSRSRCRLRRADGGQRCERAATGRPAGRACASSRSTIRPMPWSRSRNCCASRAPRSSKDTAASRRWLARRQPFDVLISDVGMPKMDGYQLIDAGPASQRQRRDRRDRDVRLRSCRRCAARDRGRASTPT